MKNKKNKSAKKSQKKYSLKFWILIVSSLTLIIVLSFCLIYFLYLSKSLKTDSNEVMSLYSYLGNDDLKQCNGLSVYSESKQDQSDIKNDMKICNAYTHLSNGLITNVKIDKTKKENACKIDDESIFATDNYKEDFCSVTKVDIKDINTMYHNLYGIELKEHDDFQLNQSTICKYSDGFYYCGLAKTYTYTFGQNPMTYRSIKKAVEKGNNTIVIYDYFLKITADKCYGNYNEKSENSKCTDELNNKPNFDYNFLKKYGTLYKHVFIKSNDNYYWESSTPVK
jgi:flagellar basal body-associated protein FliL